MILRSRVRASLTPIFLFFFPISFWKLRLLPSAFSLFFELPRAVSSSFSPISSRSFFHFLACAARQDASSPSFFISNCIFPPLRRTSKRIFLRETFKALIQKPEYESHSGLPTRRIKHQANCSSNKARHKTFSGPPTRIPCRLEKQCSLQENVRRRGTRDLPTPYSAPGTCHLSHGCRACWLVVVVVAVLRSAVVRRVRPIDTSPVPGGAARRN